jgi:Uma2 family endonuclease
MATAPTLQKTKDIDYPTSDGRPMAETDWHRILMVDLIEMLQAWFAHDEMIYVSGNLLVFYEEGNRRRHISPDVFVVKGAHNHRRNNYLIWEEKDIDLAIELTSKSTEDEDQVEKKTLYRDVLRVAEYYMFDPRIEYMSQPLQGFRRYLNEYVPIEPVNGRLPSEVLGLHLERSGEHLKLWNPTTRLWLPTSKERNLQQTEALHRSEDERQRAQEARQRAERDKLRAEQERIKAEQERDRETEARRRLEEELARLRSQMQALADPSKPSSSSPPNPA